MGIRNYAIRYFLGSLVRCLASFGWCGTLVYSVSSSPPCLLFSSVWLIGLPMK